MGQHTRDTLQFDDSQIKSQDFDAFIQFCIISFLLPQQKQSLKQLSVMKLCLNLPEVVLGLLCGIHQSTLPRMFCCWIQVMANSSIL